MKWLILLSGCGLGDGSCIEETILAYTVLDKYQYEYLPVAEDLAVPSVNHLTEQLGEERSLLAEAARIGRGRIADLAAVAFDAYDALLIPGGIGLCANYIGSHRVAACVRYFADHKKIGTMCAGMDFLRGILGQNPLKTETDRLEAASYCCDSHRTIFYTPAFRKTANCYTILQGIDAMVRAMAEP